MYKFLPWIFPFCKQAPLKDPFHHVKGIIDQSEGFGHPLHDAFRSGMWDILLKRKNESIGSFMKYYKEGKKDSIN
jgi:hypothetical protein